MSFKFKPRPLDDPMEAVMLPMLLLPRAAVDIAVAFTVEIAVAFVVAVVVAIEVGAIAGNMGGVE